MEVCQSSSRSHILRNVLSISWESLFDNRVELNNTVKIKFLSNEKELNVKLVDYIINGTEIFDGVQ
mgnify:CR=1 FL=1|jgi:transcription elongation GreA/GreB family factor